MRFSVIPFFLLSVATTSVLASPQPKAAPGPARAVDAGSDLESRTFISCPGDTEFKYTKCCPKDSYEYLFHCICNDNSKSLSADGKKCESKCTQAEWKFYNTQCCPPGSNEKNGKCEVSHPVGSSCPLLQQCWLTRARLV